jgi:hypothetical protein
MGIAREHPGKKAPSQSPTDFYKGQQRGGTKPTAQRVGDKLTGGPQREQVYGRKNLSKQ